MKGFGESPQPSKGLQGLQLQLFRRWEKEKKTRDPSMVNCQVTLKGAQWETAATPDCCTS